MNGKSTNHKVHRLVAQAFIPNPNNLSDVNHKDENRKNNNVENLEWMSHVDNCNYGTRNERSKVKRSKPVQQLDADGNVVKTADQEVTLSVRGARFLGMENGDIMDASVTGRQAKNRLRVRGGRLVGYFQLPESANEVTIQASSSFLQSAEIKL
jgi:hypothetical protein